MNKIFSILLSLLTMCTFGQDTNFIDLDYKNRPAVFAYYDNAFKDTLYIPDVEFKDYKYRKEGTITRIFKNKLLVTTVITKSDTVYTRHFYPNGKLMALNIEGLRNLTWYYKENYYSNGQLYVKMPLYDTIIFNVKTFWSNGNLMEDAYYYGGMYLGPYKFYYENGQLKEEGQFRDIPKSFKNYNFEQTTREGNWKFYDNNGNLIKSENYKNEKFKKE